MAGIGSLNGAMGAVLAGVNPCRNGKVSNEVVGI
jgi:hypothetical protein